VTLDWRKSQQSTATRKLSTMYWSALAEPGVVNIIILLNTNTEAINGGHHLKIKITKFTVTTK